MGDFRKIVTGRGLVLLLPCVISILTEEQGDLKASGHGLIAGASMDIKEDWCDCTDCSRASNVGFGSVASSWKGVFSDEWFCMGCSSFMEVVELHCLEERANSLWKLEFRSWSYAEIGRAKGCDESPS
jgi:hypothetical protein